MGLTAGNTLNEKEAEAGSNDNFPVTPSKETETAEELPPRDITG